MILERSTHNGQTVDCVGVTSTRKQTIHVPKHHHQIQQWLLLQLHISLSVDNTSTFNAFTFLATTLDHNYMVSNKDVNVKADVVLAGIVDYFLRRINTHIEYMSLVSFYNSRTVFRVKSNINYSVNVCF